MKIYIMLSVLFLLSLLDFTLTLVLVDLAGAAELNPLADIMMKFLGPIGLLGCKGMSLLWVLVCCELIYSSAKPRWAEFVLWAAITLNGLVVMYSSCLLITYYFCYQGAKL